VLSFNDSIRIIAEERVNIVFFSAVYIVVWSLIVSMLLPIGNRPDDNPVPGQVPSAPANPRLKPKMMLAAGIALPLTYLVMQLAGWAN
jgi:predicted secreted protein